MNKTLLTLALLGSMTSGIAKVNSPEVEKAFKTNENIENTLDSMSIEDKYNAISKNGIMCLFDSDSVKIKNGYVIMKSKDFKYPTIITNIENGQVNYMMPKYSNVANIQVFSRGNEQPIYQGNVNINDWVQEIYLPKN